ncbi:hypothetical protein N665_3163s0001 [Sinapis alba]|nr:hypothetical protein N665_3163s0001 [Sinapis alba]
MVFTKMAEKRNVTDFIMNVGDGGPGGGVPVAAPVAVGGASAAAPAKEEKKNELTGESDGDLRFGLILA